MIESALERWTAGGWRGPLLAALVALIAALPGVFAMPVLDRDEARFAQATAQMLETHDLVSIRFQDQPRYKKPVGIHWLQAASVSVFSAVEKRHIWAWRLPSLLAAMAAAAACAWGAAAWFGARSGFLAGAVLGASLILSTEGFIAKTDAVLCACVTLMMAALGRIYAASRGEAAAGVGTRALFWLGLSLAVLVKGPIGPMVALASIAALWIWDRKAPWLKTLGWGWGIALLLLVAGPWAMAETVMTDGAFWSGAVMGDMVSKIGGGQESHGALPGLHVLLTPLLIFPSTILLPAALVLGWKERANPAVRFALCWLLPSWLIFELTPTKLPHYTLPLYGALAWLIAAAVERPVGRIAGWTGAGLGALAAAVLGGAAFWLAATYGGSWSYLWAALAALCLAGAALAGPALLLWRKQAAVALLACIGFGALAHDAIAAGLAPTLQTLWVSRRVAHALAAADIDPRNGVTPGPVTVAGYAEPSLVFALGTRTELGDAEMAASAISQGRPAIVEAGQLKEFQELLGMQHAGAAVAGEVRGLNYSKGKPVDLFLYRSLEPAVDEQAADQESPER